MTTIPQYDSPDITLTAAATIGAFIRVKIDSNGKVAVAAATDVGVGTTSENGAVSGSPCLVHLFGRPRNMTASAAIVTGSKLFATASGKVDDADPGSARVVGVALNSAAADGDIVSVVPCDYVS